MLILEFTKSIVIEMLLQLKKLEIVAAHVMYEVFRRFTCSKFKELGRDTVHFTE